MVSYGQLLVATQSTYKPGEHFRGGMTSGLFFGFFAPACRNNGPDIQQSFSHRKHVVIAREQRGGAPSDLDALGRFVRRPK